MFRFDCKSIKIEMGLTRGMKRPIEILYKRLSSPANCGHAYSTSTAFRGISNTSRTYSSEVSSSEQMNLIKQLRERTSAPIKEVKSALVSCNWDIEAAQKDLRKRGVVLASKKSSRTAAEGLLALAQNQNNAVVVELNCETDFVARNDIFQYLALSLAKSALQLEGSTHASVAIPVSPESLVDLKMSFNHPKLTGERTVQNAITEIAAMMGENVKLGGGFTISAPSHGVLSTYLHTSPQPGRIAGLLSLEVEDKNASLDAVQRVGSEIAMHVVAAKPLFLTKEDVTSDALANERDILRSQAESTGKSHMAIDKMVEGRLRKYFEEVVLLEQKFVVDDSVNIKTLLNNLSKEVGSTVKIGNFLRVEVGEGLKRLEAVSGAEPLSQAA
ncbi:elongation factor ts mitochondrial [Phtheirospermum japonicum]|uniref:Elongation factor Ts, mitochondrial n=1 Tax=Phtheirospermum japonicum TaxID=374723 RepID=A0A830BEA2_9LAMI|nr:elongation factor ts mitochondrial [Phtheirospermum japonicum]